MTILAKLSDAELRRALERADQRKPIVRITEAEPGHMRANVQCLGTCPVHDYLDGWHDCIITWQGIGTCDDTSTKGLCVHLAAFLVANGGQLPPAPPCGPERGCGAPIAYAIGGNGHACDLKDELNAYYEPPRAPTYDCERPSCGKRYASEFEAVRHARREHAGVGDFVSHRSEE